MRIKGELLKPKLLPVWYYLTGFLVFLLAMPTWHLDILRARYHFRFTLFFVRFALFALAIVVRSHHQIDLEKFSVAPFAEDDLLAFS